MSFCHPKPKAKDSVLFQHTAYSRDSSLTGRLVAVVSLGMTEESVIASPIAGRGNPVKSRGTHSE